MIKVLQVFLQSLLIGYSGAVMPGSLLTYTIDRSFRCGPKSGLIISGGHALLELLLVILILAGFGKYLGSAAVQIMVGLLGGVVLIFLGGGMIKDGISQNLNLDFSSETEQPQGSLLFSGAFLSICNPYFLVWWAVVGLGLIMNAYKSFGLTGIILVYCGHILADISWYGLVSALVSKTKDFFNPRIYHSLIVVLGALLVIFGFGFFLNSLKLILH